MMGTLAGVLAQKKIQTPEDLFWANVEGYVENIDNVLKITTIKVDYNLKVPEGKTEDAMESFSSYLDFCPGAQSVIGCIDIRHDINIAEIAY